MAKIYDYFMAEVPYHQWVDFYETFTINHSNPSVLDLGCGTGEMSFRLESTAGKVVGIDLSEEMIEQANNKKPETSSVMFEQANLVQLSLDEQFDVIVSFLDVLNYITDQNQVKESFQRIKNHLKPGGTFLFDVHSLKHMNQLIADEIYSYITDELSYVWFCLPGQEKGEVHYDLTFFVAENDGRYKRFDEEHTQRTFLVHQYKQWLEQVGFSNVRVYADFNFFEESEEGDRLFFVCEAQ
ncbi:class I SAM-dependent DNA methyltransferase [Allobacillus saliphilus]|nr:class I SAM-dependent methyltransferase [Allobacillus saliphilus]